MSLSSSIKFFRNLRADQKHQFAVIGLGRFGRAVCSTLHHSGHEVMAVDMNEKSVAKVLTDKIAVRAVQLDSTDPTALREAGIFEFDTVIVAIGNYIQESIITTMNVKEGGVAHVVAKASSEIHEQLLKKVGADHVVFPEHEMGATLARSLTQPGILDRFALGPDNSIAELIVPEEFHGKTIAELKLRSRYGLNLLVICSDDVCEVNPDPYKRLTQGSLIVVIGSNKGVEQLPL
ncbi:MAG: TrkA family potassium uptake protein [Leptolyngbyaceae bacterium]|nr:TrkA family potassium uptake protein [Leptolyngbyaceae bacterium]